MYLRFKNDKNIYDLKITIPQSGLVMLHSPLPEGIDLTAGFELLTCKNNGVVYGKYLEYTTIYKELENGSVILSNDGSVWEPAPEPEPLPEPEPYIPTIEELQEAKVKEMNNAQQMAIQAGINVTWTDGTVEHFTLSDHDQTSLMGLQAQVAQGIENIPWHTSDESEHCKFYSNADMELITSTALSYVIWHVTYFRDLRIFIRSLQTKEEIENITYGVEIPVEYQSEPLKAMIAAQ